MIDFLLEIATLILFAVVAAWLGIEVETLERIVALVVGAVVVWIVARSAYRDACRRQTWPGKNREKRWSLSSVHDSVRSSPSATNR
jgi:multisubunit Na+/H+ antiporter MnhB subunit